jgi:hypothetical protein
MASLVITLAARYITEPQLKWATIVLIGFCLLTIGLATYAVMPKLPLQFKGKSRPDVSSSSFNLLYFGDFVKLDYDEFESAMTEVLQDPQRIYAVQIREIYTLGMFLAKVKYRFLKLAYATFITGAFAAATVGVLVGM